MRVMFDSTTPGRSIPSGARMALGYIDGLYTKGNFAALCAAVPNAVHVSCTVVGTPGAKVGDCENGDMDPVTLGHWMAGEVRAGRHPTGYCNSSTWPQAEAVAAMLGLRPIVDISYGIAQYDNDPTIPADWLARGCVFKQYRSDTAANLDYSVVADYWPGVDPPLTKEQAMDREGEATFVCAALCARDPSAAELAAVTQPNVSDRQMVLTFLDSPDGTAIKLARRAQAGLH